MDQAQPTCFLPNQSGPKAGELGDLHATIIQNVSHELRTPVAVMLGYAEMLCIGDLGTLTPEQQQATCVIVKRADELRALVEQMSILMEVKAYSGNSTPVALDKIVTEAINANRPSASQTGLTLEARLQPGLPPIPGNLCQLQQAIGCLLDNAIKFTPDGGRTTP